jgi:hypothetical protein
MLMADLFWAIRLNANINSCVFHIDKLIIIISNNCGVVHQGIEELIYKLICHREVHVWYLLPDEVNDASQLKMYMDLLSSSERKNALAMNGEKLQKGAVLSRALVRTTLSRCM